MILPTSSRLLAPNGFDDITALRVGNDLNPGNAGVVMRSMNPISLDSQIHSRISSFAAELSALVKQAALESVQAALGGSTPAQARRGRPKGSKNVAKRGPGRPKSSPNGSVDSDKILAHVRANPGVQSSEIASAFRLSVAEARDALTKLMASRVVRREGQKRGTRYFAGGKVAAPKKAKAKRKISPELRAQLVKRMALARAVRAKRAAAQRGARDER